MRKAIVGVMGPGEGASAESVELARKLGRLIAQEGWVTLSGGRNVGVMQAVNAGAKEVAGSLTVGILPSATSDVSPDVDIMIVTEMHNARNNINVLSSDVVVACGNAGMGTVSEIALALKGGKTVFLLGADQETRALFRKLGHERVVEVDTPEEAIETIRRHALCR